MKGLANPHTGSETEPIASEAVHAQLERIFASISFRQSKRLTKFLRFVVEKATSGEIHDLKERTVGIEVFDRPFDYDLSADPVVRVSAGEIRKRLAQYYVLSEHTGELRIELPSGSYVPSFSWPTSNAPAFPLPEDPSHFSIETGRVEFATDPVATVRRGLETTTIDVLPGRSRRALYIGVAATLALTVVSLFAYFWFRSTPARELEAFWAPSWTGESTLICIGDLNFLVSDGNVAPRPSDSVETVMGSRNHVGPNDLAAFGRIAGMLGRRGRPFSVLLADVATLTDMRAQPAILIGASDNRWTTQLLSHSRFQIVRNATTHVGEITDARVVNNHKWALSYEAPISSVKRDFALVSRIEDPLTGHVEVIVSGVGPFGTAAASEFVTNPQYFERFVEKAPSGWKGHNIQIVLSTEVIDGRSGPPSVETIQID